MKSYEQFQHERLDLDESIIGRVAGAANRMRQGASNMMGSANKAMTGVGSNMRKMGSNVASSVKKNVPKAVNQVKKTGATTARKVGEGSRSLRFKAANVMADRNVRSGLSGIKKGLQNIRGKTYTGGGLTKQFTTGSGVVDDLRQGVKDRAKFERSKVIQYDKPTKDRFGNVTGGKNASGQKLPVSRAVVQRGRQLDKDGNPMDRGKRGKSIINKITSAARRKIGLSDVKPKPEKQQNKGGGDGATSPTKITGPSGMSDSEREAQSGGKSKGTGSRTVSLNRKGTGTEIDPKTKKKIIRKPEPVTTKGGAKITDGGGTRLTGNVTSEKGDDGKVKISQKPGEDQKVVTTGNRQYIARPTDDPERLKQTTKRPPGSIQSRITGDLDRNDVVTDVDKKPTKGRPGQAVRMPGTEQQKKSKRRIEKQIKNTTPSRGGEGATDDPATSPKVTYGKKDKNTVTTNTTPRDDSKTNEPVIKKAGRPKGSTKVKKTPAEKAAQQADMKRRMENSPVGRAEKAREAQNKKKTQTTSDKEPSKNTTAQKKIKKIVSQPDASRDTKKQIQQQQSMNDPRRPGSDDLSDGGNTERGGTKPYKPPSKIESQNIQTKSVINQSRKKNQNATKKSKGGDAKSGGGNQKENKNRITKKYVKLPKNNRNERKTTKESFSHWREEFIWETDKKYPEKVKEIKPMSGKNTITINPEDESSKYKRGY